MSCRHLNKSMAKSDSFFLDVEGYRIPITLYIEKRLSARVSVGKKKINLRIPKSQAYVNKERHISWAKDWIKKLINENEKSINHLLPKQYKDGDTISILGRTLTLRISEALNRTSHKCSLRGDELVLELIMDEDPFHLQEAIKSLLSRTMAHLHKPYIVERVHHFNDLYFNQEIKQIKMRRSRSNWGSCSSRGNLNFSTRLLFAPRDVIDYVIVHELAHLIEFNHSKRFWNLVGQVIPNYEEHEQWLKEFGHTCNF